MRLIKRAIHLDFHTMGDIPDFAENFDAKEFAQTLKKARVDYVNVFAKCNIGWAYYPTEVGTMHPHLKFDMFGQILEECHKVGIGVSAYFNGGLDHEMARKHRDWTVVNKEGQVIYGDRSRNFFRTMCHRTGFRQYLLGMIQEVVEKYPVDGIFVDSLSIFPCYGNECLEGMVEAGLDPLNDEHVTAYRKTSIIELCQEIKDIVGEDKFLYCNGIKLSDTAKFNTHKEIEFLPGHKGYDFFPAQVAYARNLFDQTFYMTGRFHVSWGDFGGFKGKASLLNDCWDAISNAVPTSIGDHMHPRDGLDQEVYRVIGEVHEVIEAYEPWTDYAKAVADIGILILEDHELGDNHSGAVRMLGELNYTYDIIHEHHDLNRYKVIIMPDDISVTPVLQQKLEDFIKQGGGVISSGRSGLNPEGTAFALDEWNVQYDGEDPCNSSYFKMLKDTKGNVPDMLCGIYNQGIFLQLKEGSESIADYFQPYFNREWDGFHGSFYTPPDRYAGRPAVAQSGNIFQICFNIFTSYMDYAVPAHKYVIQYCLEQLLPDPIVKCEGIPTTARVTVTEKDKMKMIHIKTTTPEPRGKYNIIEDLPVLPHAVVSLKGDRVGKVYVAPHRKPIPYEQQNGYIRIELPEVEGYMMVVVEP